MSDADEKSSPIPSFYVRQRVHSSRTSAFDRVSVPTDTDALRCKSCSMALKPTPCTCLHKGAANPHSYKQPGHVLRQRWWH
eukprot:2875566-Pleurochrysis_carterae.AAC.4